MPRCAKTKLYRLGSIRSKLSCTELHFRNLGYRASRARAQPGHLHSPPHKNSPSSKIDNSINMAAINLALKAANTQEAPNYSQIAREFRVNRYKLSRLYRGITRLKGVLQ